MSQSPNESDIPGSGTPAAAGAAAAGTSGNAAPGEARQGGELTPPAIVRYLDQYIIGQARAKKAMAVALRNRWRRMNAADGIREEIVPSNILMIGPTGVGKTEIARRLSKLVNAPFIKVEASKYTEVGYVGRDVESMIRDLTESAVGMVRRELQEKVADQAAEAAQDRILDILIPPSSSDSELNERTRAKFREKLDAGELEERRIEIDVQEKRVPNLQVFGPQAGMDDALGSGLQDLLSSLGGRRKTTKTVSVAEARKILTEEEAAKRVDQEQVVQTALHRVQTQGIVFIDEIDKIAESGAGGEGGRRGADVSRQGVQRDLLPIVEGSAVNTKYGVVHTDHILFIGSGAFHVARPSDLIPELQGRFPIRVELDALTEEDFYRILTIPRHALTRQYQALLASDGSELTFGEDALREIARIAAEVNQRVENIGARRLQTILASLLEELLYAIPEQPGLESVQLDRAYVQRQLNDLVTDRDLSHFIL